jgi:hypothetical protein
MIGGSNLALVVASQVSTAVKMVIPAMLAKMYVFEDGFAGNSPVRFREPLHKSQIHSQFE